MARIHVDLTLDALSDLEDYRDHGNLRAFLGKLVKLEEDGVEVGQPLGRNLATFRKIVVGDRNWRIIYQASTDGQRATVWVIGDRSDSECYKLAVERVAKSSDGSPEVRSLVAILYSIVQDRDGRSSRRST